MFHLSVFSSSFFHFEHKKVQYYTYRCRFSYWIYHFNWKYFEIYLREMLELFLYHFLAKLFTNSFVDFFPFSLSLCFFFSFCWKTNIERGQRKRKSMREYTKYTTWKCLLAFIRLRFLCIEKWFSIEMFSLLCRH